MENDALVYKTAETQGIKTSAHAYIIIADLSHILLAFSGYV